MADGSHVRSGPPGVDITYASNTDTNSDVVFTATTEKGRQWMATDTVTLPPSEAAKYLEEAKASDLLVVSLAG